MLLPQAVRNFGRNLCFTPRRRYAPRTDAEVLDILDQNAEGTVRVVGSRHAWSPAIVSHDVLLDLRHFDRVRIDHGVDGEVWATVGGGCQIKNVLEELHSRSDFTLPALGMITEQTIAGATATGTHGSGRNSLSHYLEEVRFAAYDPHTGKARIYLARGGDELRAARCALGCVGVVLSVRLRCVPQYLIAESIALYETIDETLAREEQFPRQHFFLIPHLWKWFALQQREVALSESRPSRFAWLFKLYTTLVLDVGFHLILKLLLSLRRPALIRRFFGSVLPSLVFQQRTFLGRSDQFLTIHIERFRHFEMELFVPRAQVREADRFVQEVLSLADGASESISSEFAPDLDRIGLLAPLYRCRGTFTHHYPVTFRRVLSDDTLISMASGLGSSERGPSGMGSSGLSPSETGASGTGEPWYAISFITYLEPRDQFLVLADLIAHSMAALFGARPHWGKHCPLAAAEIEPLYPQLAAFREICRRYDPHGVFRNDFCNRTLGFAEVAEEARAGERVEPVADNATPL